MSEAEYLALPEEKPYLEYVDGVAVQKAMPNRTHGRLQRKALVEFDRYGESHGGECWAEGRVWLPGSGDYRLPDVAYWAADKPQGDDRRSLPPTVAIEIASPGESVDAQRAKCRAFRQNGVDVCWLIDPETRSVEVFEGDRDGVPLTSGGALTSVHLPDFVLPLAALWSVLDS
jgi:Uma2 family endonuclease